MSYIYDISRLKVKYLLYVISVIKQIICYQAACKAVLLSIFAKTSFMGTSNPLKDLINCGYVS